VVLVRQIGEKIMIDGGIIVVAILGIEGRKVKVGIEAPKHISIDREEIYLDKLHKKKREPPRER
jgi:carbon storage regulator